jgi:hypothetical protein
MEIRERVRGAVDGVEEKTLKLKVRSKQSSAINGECLPVDQKRRALKANSLIGGIQGARRRNAIIRNFPIRVAKIALAAVSPERVEGGRGG